MRRSLTAFLLAAGATAVAPRLATASAVTFDAPTISVTREPYDQTGYFDVTVFQTTGGSSLYQYQVDLILSSGSSSISFINADLNTSSVSPGAPYVFNVNAGGQGEEILPYVDSNEVANSNALSNLTYTDPPVLSSTPYGLVRVEYDIPANTPLGSYALTLNQSSSDSPLGAEDYISTTGAFGGLVVSPHVIDGAINVVPEPSSDALLAVGAVGLFLAASSSRLASRWNVTSRMRLQLAAELPPRCGPFTIGRTPLQLLNQIGIVDRQPCGLIGHGFEKPGDERETLVLGQLKCGL